MQSHVKYIFIVFFIALSFRILLFPHPYSGYSTINPRKGDFEAQRHWKELTFAFGITNKVRIVDKIDEQAFKLSTIHSNQNVAYISRDLVDTTTLDINYIGDKNHTYGAWLWYRYDLQYWGLDYPPLSAYHSYLMGLVASWIYPEMIKFVKSRGIDTWQTIWFMRSSVLLIDALVFLPSIIFLSFELWNLWKNTINSENNQCLSKDKIEFKLLSSSKKNINIFSLLFIAIHPSLLLIDNGHFQYNSFSIGLTIWSVYFCLKKRIFIASILFVLALNYKIMALYYALPIFFYILSDCFTNRSFFKGALRVVFIGSIVISTFIICWLPFLQHGEWKQVLKRIFPFERGVFEDYVASFWCTIHPMLNFVKRRILKGENIPHLPLISAALTLISSLPSNIMLFFKPSFGQFLYSLTITSLSFFLLSFHVHEKTILFPAIISSFLVYLRRRLTTVNSILFGYLSIFSLYPLIIKDSLQIAYISISLLYIITFIWPVYESLQSFVKRLIIISVILISLLLQLFISLIPPPSNLPYLYIYFQSSYCFFGFSICWLIYFIEQYNLFKMENNRKNLNDSKLNLKSRKAD